MNNVNNPAGMWIKSFELIYFTFIEDIKNYKDLTHYSSKFNSMFLNDFSLNKSTIDASNYNIHLQSLERRANKLDLQGLAQLIKQ